MKFVGTAIESLGFYLSNCVSFGSRQIHFYSVFFTLKTIIFPYLRNTRALTFFLGLLESVEHMAAIYDS